MQNMPIAIFRGDDTDALGYQTIVGTIRTDLDLTGCKAVFKYLSFSAEFDPIPGDKKLTVIIPASETKKFPPGLGYASLRVYDAEGKLCTFSNRIMVFVATKTPMFGNEEFEVDFNVRPELEPLKIFVGPNPDDFDEYRGFIEKVIDRASAEKYGLAMLLDAIDSDLGADDGVAATPVAVKAAYAAVIGKLTDDYYTKEETDEAIDRVAAYYITYDAAGNPFPTYAALANATTVYSGGQVRVPTRNDYCVVLADETHQGAEYRYIYAVAEGQTVGSWQPQFPVEGVMTVDQTVTKDSQNPVSGGGVWSAIWGALTALPTGFSSLYDWCVSQLAGKASKSDVDSLLFAQYYPDGSVKSAAEFTPGIKYDDPDTVNRTITVKPFCNIDGTAANDNSNLSGRVVIPPFVDASGNGYISDDGTRFKVVGVSGGMADAENQNLIAIVTPTTVTNIGEAAFGDCASLTSVSLPTADSIGDVAFAGCDVLTCISLPAATRIGGSAFFYCTNLTSVLLPAATNIEFGAFWSCTSLESVDFGAAPRQSVPMLGGYAFNGVPTTCKIIVPDAQYDAWTAASGWSDLYANGYKFLKHSEWEYARKYELDGKQDALSAQQLANIAAVSDALAFDATHTYAAGDPVVYNGTLYTFTTRHTGAWTGSDVSAVDIIARLAGKLDKTTFVAPFSASATYEVGMRCVYNNTIYRCTTYHDAMPWDPSDFVVDESTIGFLSDTGGIVRGRLTVNESGYAHGGVVIEGNNYTVANILMGVDYGGIIALFDNTAIYAFAFKSAGSDVGCVLILDNTPIVTEGSAAHKSKLDSTSAAPAFSTSSTYAVGDHVTYNGALYRCTTAVTTAGAWDASKWASDTMTNALHYDRITITTGQLQDHAVQKVTLNAATTTLSLPALTSGKVSDFGIDMVNAYEVSDTPTAASFTLAGTIGTDYNLIVPEGEDWSEMSSLAAGEMAVYYFTLSAFAINDKPTWEVMKKVVTLVPVPVSP